MQVRTLPPTAGWAWLREGIALLRRQPVAFTALVVLYTMGLMLVASVLPPPLGLLVAAVFVPFGTLAVTAAGRDTARNVMPLPSLLLDGFKGAQRNALLRLGAINAGLLALLSVATSLLASDDLAAWQVVDGRIDPASIAANMPWDAIVAGLLLYTPILMLTWFAPQLVAWHRQPVGKAMFFSLFACWRNRWPFLVLGVALAALIIGTSWLSGMLISAIGLSTQLGSLLLAPIALLLTSVAYSTQYPIYRTVLDSAPASEADTPDAAAA